MDCMLNRRIVSGGSGSIGFTLKFPATAANWDKAGTAYLYIGDGTTKNISNFSSVAGQSISNVVGLQVLSSMNNPFFVFRMKLESGNIALKDATGNFSITNSPNTTPTGYGMGQVDRRFWWPLSDIVLSTIEMYNTD